MTRRKHADLMIAYAEDSSLEIEHRVPNLGEWCSAVSPTWSQSLEYRIKPKTHKWQHLIDIQKEHPNTVFEMGIAGEEWQTIYAPIFDSEIAEYRVKPKSITLHQYVFKKTTGEFFLGVALYKNIQEAKVAGGNSFEVIGPAPWTAYTIEE